MRLLDAFLLLRGTDSPAKPAKPAVVETVAEDFEREGMYGRGEGVAAHWSGEYDAVGYGF